MKKILVLSAVIIIVLCMFLYIKNNPAEPIKRVEGTFALSKKGRTMV